MGLCHNREDAHVLVEVRLGNAWAAHLHSIKAISVFEKGARTATVPVYRSEIGAQSSPMAPTILITAAERYWAWPAAIAEA